MRRDAMRPSENVEDRRARGPQGRLVAGGGLGLVAILVIYALLGGNPAQLMRNLPPPGQGPGAIGAGPASVVPADPAEQELADLARRVLGDTEDVWSDLFASRGERYPAPTLVLFRGRVESACGLASAAVGPFYCPGDERVYIDLSFYRELSDRFGAPGDFAQAYCIAHEVGHHIQNLTGTMERVREARQRLSEAEANELSVRLELQADFYAGVWAHHAQRARGILEPGDIEEGLRAAAAIGDDRLQKQAQGYVVPDSFTHGSSEQRVRWFRKGLESGDIRQGDTFGASAP